ncbi:hypothetical protein H4218_005332, partial [Coemansia sp. IMI 209128]
MYKRRLLVVGLFIMAGPLQKSMAAAAKRAPDRYGHLNGQPISYTLVFAILFGLYVVYIFTTYFAFVYRATYLRDKSLLDRSVFLLSVNTFGGVIFASSALIHGFLANFPCFIEVWMLSLGYVMWFTTIILYMARYYVIARLHRSIATEQRVNPVTPDNLVEYMRRLRVATQGAFWQSNAGGFDAATDTNRLSVGTRIKGGRPSLIKRMMLWRRKQAAAKSTESDTKTSQQDRGQFSLDPGLERAPDGVVLDVAPSDGERDDVFFSSGGLPRQSTGISSYVRRKAKSSGKWARRCQSNRFASYILLGMFVAVVGYLALLSTLFTRLKLERIYYNCFNGYEYIPQAVIAGVFNVIIQPAYMVIIWNYHDAYSIRNLMFISSVTGVICWAGILTWRVNRHWGNLHVSAYVIYIIQMVFVHTCYTVIPLINSIRLSYSQRARQQEQERQMSADMGLDEEHSSAHYDPNDLFQAASDSTKKDFLKDMRNADKHEEVNKFAALCFCTELVSFLDVFQAFKICVYQDTLASVSRPLSSGQLGDSADPCATVELQLVADIGSTQSPGQMTAQSTTNNGELQAAVSPRTSVVVGRSKLAQAIFNCGSLKSVLRSKRKAPEQESQQDTGETPQTNNNLQNLAAGIAKTMALAFPDQGISRDTEFSESLREPLSALIDTFILPESS